LKDVFTKIRNSFHGELLNEGDIWRILRKQTLLDLVKLDFLKYRKENEPDYLISVFNYCMKAKLIDRIGRIDPSKTLEQMNATINIDNQAVLDVYDDLFDALKQKIENYSSLSLYDLNRQIDYIRVAQNLDTEIDLDEIFEEILCLTYNIISKL
jgi:hypothetical protein